MAQDLLHATSQEQLGEKTDWFTLLTLQLQSEGTRTSDLQRTVIAAGIMLEIITNNEAGAPTFTPKILVPDAAGGSDIVIVSFTAISSSGTNILVLHPAAADVGNEDKVGVLPREWKLELTYAGADTTHRMDTTVYGRYI